MVLVRIWYPCSRSLKLFDDGLRPSFIKKVQLAYDNVRAAD